MASSRTGIVLNLFLRSNCRLGFPLRLFHSALPNCSIKQESVKPKRTSKTIYEKDYLLQKSIVADFVGKGNLDGLDHLREQVLNAGATVNKFSFDAHFISTCLELGAFELGRDFFRVLHSEGRAGMGAVGRYFELCHAFPNKCDPHEKEFMLKVYDELLEKYDVLDVSTCEAVAQGIVITNRWRTEIPRLLDMVRHSDVSPSPSLWTAAVESAFLHQDHALGWEYLDMYANSGKPITPRIYEIVLEQKGTLPLLFRWLEKHGIILNVECAEVFMSQVPSHDATAKSSLVSRKGFCKACRKTLQPSRLSQEEFETLRSAFLDPVLIGKDVFQKTRPEELKNFHNFLKQVLPVDVVLDGLNIAYVGKRLSANIGAKLLRFVTSHFVSKGCKILVVGRQHMNRWPSKDMSYIKNHASVFLADDVSQDDPFLLYAALKSGIGTKFVSRDRMNGHRFLLGQPHLRRIFSKWQALHQYHPLHISEDGNSVALRSPTDFVREPQQTSGDLWHLPVVDHNQTNVQGHLQDETAPWLCLLHTASDHSPKAHKKNVERAQT